MFKKNLLLLSLLLAITPSSLIAMSIFQKTANFLKNTYTVNSTKQSSSFKEIIDLSDLTEIKSINNVNVGSLSSEYSQTEAHIKQEIASRHVDNSHINSMLKKQLGIKDENKRNKFTDLIAHIIKLEKQHEQYYPFFHGTLNTWPLIFRTMMHQSKTKSYSNFFQLRNSYNKKLEELPSAYQFAVNEIPKTKPLPKFFLTGRGSSHYIVYPFDHEPSVQHALLSCNTATLGNMNTIGESSIASILDATTLHRSIPTKQTLLNDFQDIFVSHELQKLWPQYSSSLINQSFISQLLVNGSLLVSFIPKEKISSAYLSGPYGMPDGISYDGAPHVVQNHKEQPLTKENLEKLSFPQARVLLKPELFQNPNDHVKMFLFGYIDKDQAQQMVHSLSDMTREISGVHKRS